MNSHKARTRGVKEAKSRHLLQNLSKRESYLSSFVAFMQVIYMYYQGDSVFEIDAKQS